MFWVLERVYFPEETLGSLTVVNGRELYQCKTLELPDLNNAVNVSCILEGLYLVEKLQSSPAFDYPHFHITNVPHRTGIKVHIANFKRNLKGCVAVGDSFEDIDSDGLTDVKNSKSTLNKLLKISDDRFYLWIKS